MAYQLRIAAAAAAFVCSGLASAGTLTIESWRGDDKKLWDETLLPAFTKANPGITVKFLTTIPNEYNAAVNARFIAGSAGDLITCRPFDLSLNMYKTGNLDNIANLAGMKNFPGSAKAAWSSDDGKATFCMPMASVIHGYFYNKKIFAGLGLKVPQTEAEFFAVLDRVKADGKVVPLGLGTADAWETSEIVYSGLGPNRWKGEEGRNGLIMGTKKFTDPEFVGTFELMVKLADYMPKGYQAQGYGDTQNQFSNGKSAVIPTGSWDIAHYDAGGKLEYGAFKPPVQKAGDKCYITDHTDMGMGLNSRSRNKADAQVFLNWLASKEFANLYANKVTGFFPLSNHTIEIKNPIAKEMVSWRKDCGSTIRVFNQILDRGMPSLGSELQTVSAQVVNKKLSPKDAAARLQNGLVKWYTPGK